MENQMFCYQCQETDGCSGCTRVGVCGKQPDVAAMQDLLVYVTKGISAVTTTLRQEGVEIQPAVNHMITLNLFTTITNANFSKEAIIARIQDTLSEKDLLLSKLNTLTSTDTLPEAALWNGSENEFAAKAATVGILSTENEDIRSLRELITYGLKGLSAYSKHANVLLQDNEEIDAFMQRALAATLDDSLSADDLIALTLETGKYGVDGMALLDNANTSTYGNPEITKVNIGVGTRPGILVSGHDLRTVEAFKFLFLFPVMTFVTLKCCSNRHREAVWMYTLILKCFLHTIIQLSKNIQTSLATTEMHGGNRKRNLKASTARFS